MPILFLDKIFYPVLEDLDLGTYKLEDIYEEDQNLHISKYDKELLDYLEIDKIKYYYYGIYYYRRENLIIHEDIIKDILKKSSIEDGEIISVEELLDKNIKTILIKNKIYYISYLSNYFYLYDKKMKLIEGYYIITI